MRATLKDVALKAGVSTSAVSRTFTKGASVSDRTRKKVEKAAAELNYRPNVLASSLTTRRTKLIGLVSNNFHNPVFLQVFDLFTRTLQDKGLRPLLVNLSTESDQLKSLEMLRQYQVDGVIIASSTLPGTYAKLFREALIPVVHSFGRCVTNPEIHTVGTDNVYSGQLAADLLLHRNYKRIGFLGGPKAASSTQDRLAGFQSVFEKEADIELSIDYADDYTYQGGHDAMAAILSRGQHAEVYFCGDDVLTIGAMSAATRAGLSIPDHIGFIGVNDMEMAAWDNINLTTIHQPIEEIILSSVNLLVDILDKPEELPQTRLFPCHIVERQTIRPELK